MKHILVIDDNTASLALVRENLKEYYKVTLVTDGKQALRFLEKKRPDLILLDVYMPGMNGMDVLKKMNELEDFHIPVIMLTSMADEELQDECRELGTIGFLPKPFDPEMMLEVIQGILEEG